MSNLITMITGHTCGPACWEAREDICRCECGGKNHGCLRSPDGVRPVRRAKLQGQSYSLHAVGHCGEMLNQASDMNQTAGCYYYPIAHGTTHFENCVAKVRRATDAQVKAWPELAAYRTPEWIVQGGVYLLWKLAPINT